MATDREALTAFHMQVRHTTDEGDGWREEELACGHVVKVIAAVTPPRTFAFCAQCVNEYADRQKARGVYQ